MSRTDIAQPPGLTRVTQRPTVSYGWQAGIIVGFASYVLFTLAAYRLTSAGFVPVSIVTLWNNHNLSTNLGGQWLQVFIIWLFRQIPGSSVGTLAVVTVISASMFQGFITHDLVKRGWSPLQASLGVGLTAIHPVMLNIATSGSPTLMYCMMVSVIIISLDRLEAIGDTQSLIILGLLVAMLILSWPDAIFFILPFVVLLPWAFRDIRDYSSATALFVITLAPSFIVLSAVVLGGELFHLPFRDLFTVWASTMHGATGDVIRSSSWLTANGGQFFKPLFSLTLLCFILMPRTLIVLVRFLFDRSERVRPVTGIAAIMLPPIAGAIATFYWQLSAPSIVIAFSLMSVTAWATTVNFQNWERWLWVASVVVGVLSAWLSPLLWTSPEQYLWRHIMLAGGLS